jgi:hypothetical protein
MSGYLMLLAQSDPWADSFFGLQEDYRFVLLLVVIGCSTGLLLVLACVFAGVWSSAKHKRLEAELKQDMLDRGMSAEEIEQVIEATPKEGIDSWIASWKKNK